MTKVMGTSGRSPEDVALREAGGLLQEEEVQRHVNPCDNEHFSGY